MSSITSELIDNGLISEAGIGKAAATGGRKPIYLTFLPEAGLVLTLDIGYNYLNGMLTFLNGKIVKKQSINCSITADNVLQNINDIVDKLTNDAPSTTHGIVGMAVAIHGIVVNNSIRFTPYSDLTGKSLHKQLTDCYDFPILFENEANLTALGEYTFTSTHDNIISVSIHSGIGAGIIQNGKLQIGAHGQAGEIGHTILHPNGIACACGNHGCLEKYASNKAIYDLYAEHSNLSKVNSDVLTQAISAKDKFALDLMTEKANELANALNTLAVLYDPQIIIINSSLYIKNPQYLSELEKNIKSTFAKNVTLAISSLGDDATLYGGVALVINDFLNTPGIKFSK